MPAGRPTKLTPEVMEEIVRNMASCAHPAIAAGCAGVGARTFHTWMQRGKAEASSIYGEFRHRILKAAKTSEMRLAARIAASPDTNDAKWMLTHRFPKRWAEKTRHEITGANGGPMELNVDVRADLLDRVNRIAQQRGPGKADPEPQP